MINRLQLFITLIILLGTHETQAMCESYINHYEKRHGIPSNLLRAISRIESGRTVSGQGFVAWPWTINANRKPYVFNTKAEAIAKVKELKAQGINSIDVGCMQINLKHHPTAFANLEAAFDPQTNIDYAARFLKEKMDSQGNWQGAVAHYHSASAIHNQPYKNKVMTAWQAFGNQTYAQPQLPMQTAFAINQPKVVNTKFTSLTGRTMPVQIKFSAYNNRDTKPSPPSTGLARSPGSLVRINLTSDQNRPKIMRANTSLLSNRAVVPIRAIQRANVKLPGRF